MRSYFSVWVALSLATAAAFAVQAADDPPSNVAASVSANAKVAAAAAKRDAKVVAAKAKEGAQQVAATAKEVAHEVATASKEGAKEVAAAAKRGAKKTKAVLQADKSDKAESTPAPPQDAKTPR